MAVLFSLGGFVCVSFSNPTLIHVALFTPKALFSTCPLLVRPDITVLVDWVQNTKLLAFRLLVLLQSWSRRFAVAFFFFFFSEPVWPSGKTLGW